jgi:hypothetical protein
MKPHLKLTLVTKVSCANVTQNPAFYSDVSTEHMGHCIKCMEKKPYDCLDTRDMRDYFVSDIAFKSDLYSYKKKYLFR